jgi:hypothetical protein
MNEYTTTHDMLWDIVITIVLESGTHVQKEVSHLFTTPNNEWMSLSLEMIFGL